MRERRGLDRDQGADGQSADVLYQGRCIRTNRRSLRVSHGGAAIGTHGGVAILDLLGPLPIRGCYQTYYFRLTTSFFVLLCEINGTERKAQRVDVPERTKLT